MFFAIASGLYARSFLHPLIGGIHDFGEVVVCDNSFGEVGADAGDFAALHAFDRKVFFSSI